MPTKTLAHIQKVWTKFADNQAFEYVFMDDDFAELYKNEQRTGQIMTVFAILAIFVACLGLFGLASFTAEQRTKEIGIRKVMGASVPDILTLLFREIVILVIVATVIALPLSYLGMDSWLQDFAYRIEINPIIFVIAALMALIIAVGTVMYQAMRAATANPIQALRYE